MEQESNKTETISYPYILFKINEQLFCVNSRYIASILKLPQYSVVPDSPEYITGIFPFRNDYIRMVDLRSFFGMVTLNQEYVDFSQMLDDRKKDHVHWVTELERCVLQKEDFKLATDPHKCALGVWYDQFQSKNNTVNFHLRKLDEPHKKLHAAAVEVANCRQDCEHCAREECLKSILQRTRKEYMPRILNILEDAKEIFKSFVYNEMVLVLSNGSQLGIVVDEVLAVEDLTSIGEVPNVKQVRGSECIAGIQKSEHFPGIILELDVLTLLKSMPA